MHIVNESSQFSSPGALEFNIPTFTTSTTTTATTNNKTALSTGTAPSLSDFSPPAMGHTAGRQDNLSSRSQHLNRTSSQAEAENNVCGCLKYHADLLCRLGELKHNNRPLSLDTALMSVQQALMPWKSLNQCSVCERDDDQVVLILSAMTIRAVLQILQRFCAEIAHPMGQGTSDAGARISSFDHMFDGGRLTIGKYEVTSEEQTLVTYLLILRALSKIRSAVVSLKTKLDKGASRQQRATNSRSKDGRSNAIGNDKTDILNDRPNGREKIEVPSSLPNTVPVIENAGCMQILLRNIDATVDAVAKAIPKASLSQLSHTNLSA